MRLSHTIEDRDASNVQGLVAALKERDSVDRTHARGLLVAIGGPAVEPLIRLLEDPVPHVRWEAVKALGQIGDPAATPALVGALEDDDGDVRWLAAKGLIDLGGEAMKPLLAALAYRSGSPALLEGARRIFRELYRWKLPTPVEPVLAALNGPNPQIAVHTAAYAALNAIRAGAYSAKGA